MYHFTPPEPSVFPPASHADEHGIVAITADLSPELLIDAYSHGLFPWSVDPVCWFSPEPRAIFSPETVKLPTNLQRIERQMGFTITFDQVFQLVVEHCAAAHRHEGEWISPAFIAQYTALHHQGYAHSIEVWQTGTLVGGLYGVQLGGMFSGESMFFKVSNASKVALKYTIAHLQAIGVELIDAQVINPHTASLGATNVTRTYYLQALTEALNKPVLQQKTPWQRL